MIIETKNPIRAARRMIRADRPASVFKLRNPDHPIAPQRMIEMEIEGAKGVQYTVALSFEELDAAQRVRANYEVANFRGIP